MKTFLMQIKVGPTATVLFASSEHSEERHSQCDSGVEGNDLVGVVRALKTAMELRAEGNAELRRKIGIVKTQIETWEQDLEVRF